MQAHRHGQVRGIPPTNRKHLERRTRTSDRAPPVQWGQQHSRGGLQQVSGWPTRAVLTWPHKGYQCWPRILFLPRIQPPSMG